MANPHPLPDELIGKALEVDKMSREHTLFHWNNVLQPLQEHLNGYLGDSFDHILIDSYEAGDQNWTDSMVADFHRLKGYDPLPLLALAEAGCSDAQVEQFKRDWREVVHQLFMEDSWLIARDRIHAAGLQFYWEPYTGPFDTYIGTGLADVPMGEFWTEGNGAISDVIVNAASYYSKKVVGAEAFTGAPGVSQYTEDPEFLKPLADGAFLSGVRRHKRIKENSPALHEYE